MKRYILILMLAMISWQANAQFSYSVKAGWSRPKILKGDNWDEHSSFSMGVAVDYPLNDYLGIQSGINYKRMGECEDAEIIPGETREIIPRRIHAAYAEIPLLFTASVIPTPKRWRAIWNVGMFANFPIEQYSPFWNYKSFYGVMAALQIEVSSHYFLRGEYQWALSNDTNEIFEEERRIERLSVCLGYRF